MSSTLWDKLAATPTQTLSSLFAQDTGRVDQLTVNVGDIRYDFSKTHLSQTELSIFLELVEMQGFSVKREALFTGEVMNATEGRAAEHCAERGSGSADAVAQAKALQTRMRGLIEVIEAGAFGEIRHILHIGIGGSALGPKLIMDALGRSAQRFDVKVVSNIDGCALAEAMAGYGPANHFGCSGIKDIYHHRNLNERRKRAAMVARGRGRGSLWTCDCTDGSSRKSDRMGRR